MVQLNDSITSKFQDHKELHKNFFLQANLVFRTKISSLRALFIILSSNSSPLWLCSQLRRIIPISNIRPHMLRLQRQPKRRICAINDSILISITLERYGCQLIIQYLQPGPKLLQDICTCISIKPKLYLFSINLFWEQCLIKVCINLHKGPNRLPFSCTPIASCDLYVLLHLVIGSALGQFEHRVITQFYQDFQVQDEALEVVGRDQDRRLFFLGFYLVRGHEVLTLKSKGEENGKLTSEMPLGLELLMWILAKTLSKPDLFSG